MLEKQKGVRWAKMGVHFSFSSFYFLFYLVKVIQENFISFQWVAVGLFFLLVETSVFEIRKILGR